MINEQAGAYVHYERLFTAGRIKEGRSVRNLLILYKGQYGNLLASLLLFVVKHSPVWIIPVVTADMINTASDPKAHSLSRLWLDLGIVTVAVAQNVPTNLLHARFMSRATRTMEAALRGTLMRKLQHLSMSYHAGLRAGRLQAKVLRDVEAIEQLSKQVMSSFVPAVLNVLVAVAIAASKNLLVAGFFVLAVPVSVGLMLLFKRRVQATNREFREEIEDVSGQVAESVEMLPVTRAHGLEEVEMEKIDNRLAGLKDKGNRLDITEALFGASGWVVFTLFQMLCLGLTCALAYRGQIMVGDVVMYQGFFATILMSISQMTNVYPQFARGVESIHSVMEVLLSEETEEYEGERRLDVLLGEFRFEHLYFRYRDADGHVLNDFNLTVRPGERIALVGDSGAGKSTVLNMVVGFYRPTRGRVLLDGVPLDELDMRSYRQKFAVVHQNTTLFSGTLRDNITYGLASVREEELWRVIETAQLRETVERLPQGLDTHIGERGGRLSAGQRQRVAIARAMMRDPRVVLLDEPTSALDNISEYKIQQALRELTRGRTTFIVAHRLSTVRDADRIVVVKGGACVEQGTFEELLARKGEFFRLKQMQG
jgi:ATP-binding cassette, subfamily B, bacterial